jgi:serine/threonine protein kinase
MYLTDVVVPSTTRAWPGGFADVYEGQMRGQKVAVKRLRGSAHARAQIHRVSSSQRHTRDASNLFYQSFCKEGLLWRQLEHPNILPFLGVDRHTFGEDFCMISPWMEKGTLMEFLASPDYSPAMDRMRLVIIYLSFTGEPR